MSAGDLGDFIIKTFERNTLRANDIVPHVISSMSDEEGTQSVAEEDRVNHPKHYNQYEGFEVIDVCEQLRRPDGTGGYNRGNAFKYIARAGWKSPEKEVEDLEKAIFYLQREIDRVKAITGSSVGTEAAEERKKEYEAAREAFRNTPIPVITSGSRFRFYCVPCNINEIEHYTPQQALLRATVHNNSQHDGVRAMIWLSHD